MRVNCIVQAALILVAALVFMATGSTLDVDRGFVAFFLLLFGLLFIAVRVVRGQMLILACQGLIFFVVAGFCAGFTALAALRAGAPLADGRLDEWDHCLGVHTERVMAFFASFDVFNAVLGYIYQLTVPGIIVTILVLALRQDRTGLCRMCFIFAVSAMICALFNLFLPASGSTIHHNLSLAVMRHFPAGAGVYFKVPFQVYHSRRMSVISPSSLSGVVAFPSFHAVMALIELSFLKTNRFFNGIVFIFVMLVLLSAVLIGGHYLVDIIAGAVLFYGLDLLSRRVVR
nr:phosphatase PAP2 family protein [Acetobacter oeni]